jgi:hypothetical protein
MAKDPVCGMQVDEKKAAATSVHKGTTYYFCAAAGGGTATNVSIRLHPRLFGVRKSSQRGLARFANARQL